MSDYMSYPSVWKPEQEDYHGLMMVRIPAEIQELSKEQYWQLMNQRIEWMILRWMDIAEENQREIHQRLCRTLNELNSVQEPPDLMLRYNDELQPTWAWIQEWAETFIDRNDILKQRIWVDFPVTIQSPIPQVMEQWMSVHDTMNLADWLSELTIGITSEEFW